MLGCCCCFCFCFIHFISSHRIKFNSISSFICITVASHGKVLKGDCAKSQYIFVRISWNWFHFQVFYKMIDNMSVLYVGWIVGEAIILSFLFIKRNVLFEQNKSNKNDFNLQFFFNIWSVEPHTGIIKTAILPVEMRSFYWLLKNWISSFCWNQKDRTMHPIGGGGGFVVFITFSLSIETLFFASSPLKSNNNISKRHSLACSFYQTRIICERNTDIKYWNMVSKNGGGSSFHPVIFW